MKNYQFERSEHPIFSFVAIGKKRKIVKSVGKSAFGKKSVHSRLLNKNTFFLNFFRPLEKGNTLIHHIEQIEESIIDTIKNLVRLFLRIKKIRQ